jgi:CubicO group peptidase (beta-lactamase class C family)
MSRLAMLCCVLALLCVLPAAAAAPPLDLPRLDGITVDGRAADWGERGFRITVLATDDGRVKAPDDLTAAFRLGWDAGGLLLLAEVRDNALVESPSADSLYDGDSIETFFCSTTGGGFLQAIIAPGCDPKVTEPRVHLYDERPNVPEGLSVQVARTRSNDGYLLEARYPWPLLRVEPQLGAAFDFGLWHNDVDPGTGRVQVIWPPRRQRERTTQATHRLRLAEQASPPARLAVSATHERFRRLRVNVVASADLAGRMAQLRAGPNAVAQVALSPDGGYATANFTITTLPPAGQPLPSFEVAVDRDALPVDLPDLNQERARLVLEQLPLNFHPYVFAETAFPSCDFENPDLAEVLFGPYTIETTFYDRDYRQVTAAERPGRYGAVVEVIPAAGRRLTLFRTLFRLPGADSLRFYPRASGISVQLPPFPWLDPQVVQANSASVSEVFLQNIRAGMSRDPAVPALLAGLYEGAPPSDPVTVQTDVFAQDRQWWVGLKRKLYAMDRAYPEPLLAPRPKEGPPAPVLHEGTLAEAGMAPDTIEKIDALLQRWAADSDQGFQVCIVRHGVVVMNEAYGQRDGRPMTLSDKSWMASISKLLAGTSMMMAVDQGRVKLDDSVTTFFPAFRDVGVATPLTIHRLYTHTGGMWGHWGDELHDFDQLIAYYYPYLEVGRRYEYDGAGPALGSKVLEMVSGEALPLFYKHHLLDPLGCRDTDIMTSSWDAQSTARDIAAIGQMLMNKGAYGDKRFFSEATFQQMLPVKLDRLAAGATNEYGMGTTWYKDEGLGEGTFAHGAASSATFRISPQNDLVIVMTRNDAGRNFDKYHGEFLKTVAACIAK